MKKDKDKNPSQEIKSKLLSNEKNVESKDVLNQSETEDNNTGDTNSKTLEGEETIMVKGPRDHWKIKHVDVESSSSSVSPNERETKVNGGNEEENLLRRDKDE